MAIGGWRWRSIGGGILEILLESLGPSQGEEGRRGEGWKGEEGVIVDHVGVDG